MGGAGFSFIEGKKLCSKKGSVHTEMKDKIDTCGKSSDKATVTYMLVSRPLLCLESMRAGGHYSLFIMHEYHYVTTKPCPLPVVYKEHD